jgi:hypothetical protein
MAQQPSELRSLLQQVEKLPHMPWGKSRCPDQSFLRDASQALTGGGHILHCSYFKTQSDVEQQFIGEIEKSCRHDGGEEAAKLLKLNLLVDSHVGKAFTSEITFHLHTFH